MLSVRETHTPQTHTQQERFGTLSTSITERIDDMGVKIDDLEKQIAELVQATSSTQHEQQQQQ